MMGEESFPIGVLTNAVLIFLEITFSLIQPRSPPFIPDSEILISLATFSKPSFSILFLNFSISEFNFSGSVLLITISEIKYSSNSFLL